MNSSFQLILMPIKSVRSGVSYQDRAREAQAWARQHDIKPAASDKVKICLVAIDVQNTF